MTPERRADIAFVIAIAAGLAFVFLLGPLDRRLEMAHSNDFSGFWAAGRAVDLGVDPYAADQWQRIAATVGWSAPTPDTTVPNYMPWTMLFLAAVAQMPLDLAAWVWMALGIISAAVGLRALLRHYLPGRAAEHALFGAALFFGQPTYHALVLGQWSPVLLGVLALCILSLRGDHPRRAAVATLAFLVKPQLFVFTGVGLAYGAVRSLTFRRALVWALVLGVVVVAVGWLAFPDWLGPWLSEIPGARGSRSVVLPSAGNELFGTAGRALAYVLIVVGAVVAARFPSGSDASLAAWLSLSIAGAIYAWSYDEVLLLAPLVIAAGVVLRSGAPRLARVVASLTALTFVVFSPVLYLYGVARHDETFTIIVPVAVFAVIMTVLWGRGVSDAAGTTAAARSPDGAAE